MDVWTDLRHLRKNAKIGVEQITFGVLWQIAGGVPGRFVITVKMVEKHFARNGSTLRTHLEKLAKVDLVRPLARDRRLGMFWIQLMLPLPATAEAKPNPQLSLPLEWTEGVDGLRDWLKEYGNVGDGSQCLALGEPQCSPGEAQCSGTAEETQPADQAAQGEGAFPSDGRAPSRSIESRGTDPPAGTFPRDGNFPASRELSRVTGTFPRDGNFQPGGEVAIPRDASNAPAHAGTHTPASLESCKDSIPNGTNDSNVPNDPNAPNDCTSVTDVARQGEAAERRAAIARELREAAIRQKSAKSSREARALEILAAQAQRNAEARPVNRLGNVGGEVLQHAAAQSVSTAIDAAKAEFIADLKRLVADPDAGEWLFGYLADMRFGIFRVEADREAKLLEQIRAFIGDLKLVRQTQTRLGQAFGPRGRTLNKTVHGLAEEFGIPLPAELKKRREKASYGST